MNEEQLLRRFEDMGLDPWNSEKWAKCPHKAFQKGYHVTADMERIKELFADEMCKECRMPRSVWKEAHEIQIPICTFGKKLNIKEIIERIEYVKGDKSNIGDSPDDYVRIVLNDD